MARRRVRPAVVLAGKAPEGWSDTLDRFCGWLVEVERSRHTVKNYREDLEAFEVWYRLKFDEPPTLEMLSAAELRGWKEECRVSRNLEPATVNRRLSALRSLVRWAEARGWIAEVATPKSLRKVRQPPKWLDLSEQRALVRAAGRFGGKRESALVSVLVHTGLRVEEAAQLVAGDVEIRERSGWLTVRSGKGRKQRRVPLNVEARSALGVLLGLAPDGGASGVFWGQRGPLSVRGIQSLIEKLAHHARLPDLTCHVLRHTFGHNLAVAGVPIQVIADLMGHESLETTRGYVLPGDSDLAAAVDRLAGGLD